MPPKVISNTFPTHSFSLTEKDDSVLFLPLPKNRDLNWKNPKYLNKNKQQNTKNNNYFYIISFSHTSSNNTVVNSEPGVENNQAAPFLFYRSIYTGYSLGYSIAYIRVTLKFW